MTTLVWDNLKGIRLYSLLAVPASNFYLEANEEMYPKLKPFIELPIIGGESIIDPDGLKSGWLISASKFPKINLFLESAIGLLSVEKTPILEPGVDPRAPVHFISYQEWRLLLLLHGRKSEGEVTVDEGKGIFTDNFTPDSLVSSVDWDTDITGKSPLVAGYRPIISRSLPRFLNSLSIVREMEFRYLLNREGYLNVGDLKRYSFLPLTSNDGLAIVTPNELISMNDGKLPVNFRSPMPFPVKYFHFLGGITGLYSEVHPNLDLPGITMNFVKDPLPITTKVPILTYNPSGYKPVAMHFTFLCPAKKTVCGTAAMSDPSILKDVGSVKLTCKGVFDIYVYSPIQSAKLTEERVRETLEDASTVFIGHDDKTFSTTLKLRPEEKKQLDELIAIEEGDEDDVEDAEQDIDTDEEWEDSLPAEVPIFRNVPNVAEYVYQIKGVSPVDSQRLKLPIPGF